MNVSVPVIFSGIAIVLGILSLTKFRESAVVRMLFHLALFGNGLSNIIVFRLQGKPVRGIDIGVAVVFGISVALHALLLARQRKRDA